MRKKQTPPILVFTRTRKERNAAIKAQAANREPAAVIYEDKARGLRQITVNAAARKAYGLTIYTPAAVIFERLGITEAKHGRNGTQEAHHGPNAGRGYQHTPGADERRTNTQKSEVNEMKTLSTIIIDGHEVSMSAAVALMDDDIRERVHAEMAPCSDQDFVNEYCRRHRDRYGEDFAVS